MHTASARRMPEAVRRLLEHAANRLLELDPEQHAALAALDGKVIRLELAGPGLVLYLLPGAARLELAAECRQPPHVRIRATPAELIGYLAGAAPRPGGGLEIAGDVGVAERLQAVLKQIDPDWEEELSRWLGDTAARKAGRLLRDTFHWTRRAARSTAQDLNEYLRYETAAVAERADVSAFTAAVDTLRDDVERLRARLERAGRRLPAGREP